MAFLRARRVVDAAASNASRVAAFAELDSGVHVREASAAIQAAIAARVTRVSFTTAMTLPAFARAWKIYTNTIATFPLREYIGANQVTARNLLSQTDEAVPTASLISRTVSDLICNDAAYWRVTSRQWDGYPNTAELMPFAEVMEVPNNPYAEFDDMGTIVWNGTEIPTRDVIKFTGDGSGGWLAYGGAAITTALSLETAAQNYANSPTPTITLKNTGADLPADQVDALLTAWENARADRTTAYLSSVLELKETGFNAADIQLVEGRNASALMVARFTNLDPVWLGAAVNGSSLTYSNRTDLYRQLIDLSLSPVMNLIEQRLSMLDVTPRGHTVKFDTTTFLRANTQDVSTLITQLQPLGVITAAEARLLLNLPPETV